MQHWCALVAEGPHCALSSFGSVLMSPLRARSGKQKPGHFHGSLWLIVCCEYLLIIVFILDDRTHHGTCPHLPNLMGLPNPLYSLPTQATSSFPTIQSGGKKKYSLLTISTGTLRENLQVIANGLKTFSRAPEYKEGTWILPCGNQAHLCCQLLFTEVGNGQNHAPIRALKANPLLRSRAPGLCLPAQGCREEIPFFKPPWFKLMAWRLMDPRRIPIRCICD